VLEVAVEGDGLVPKQRLDDRDRLLKATNAAIIRIAEHVVLGLVPAGTQPEDGSPVADLVDHLGHLRQQTGVAEAGADDERANVDPLGRRRDSRHRRPALPNAADAGCRRRWRGRCGRPGQLGVAANRLKGHLPDDQVVGEPGHVEADRLASADDLDHIPEARRGGAEGVPLRDRDHQPQRHLPPALRPAVPPVRERLNVRTSCLVVARHR
jgi:hypothetical protein